MGTHTFSAERDARLDGMAVALLMLAAITAVIAFFPPEGRVLVPLHGGLQLLLGRAAFLVPLVLAMGAALALTRRARPTLVLLRRRFGGLALLTLALLAGESLLGQSSGLVGDWLTTSLRDLIGSPLTAMLVVIALTLGTALALEVNPRRLIWFAKG